MATPRERWRISCFDMASSMRSYMEGPSYVIAPRCAGCGRGGLLACSGCHTARYCSAACQAAAWPTHKVVCRGDLDVLLALVRRPTTRRLADTLLTFLSNLLLCDVKSEHIDGVLDTIRSTHIRYEESIGASGIVGMATVDLEQLLGPERAGIDSGCLQLMGLVLALACDRRAAMCLHADALVAAYAFERMTREVGRDDRDCREPAVSLMFFDRRCQHPQQYRFESTKMHSMAELFERSVDDAALYYIVIKTRMLADHPLQHLPTHLLYSSDLNAHWALHTTHEPTMMHALCVARMRRGGRAVVLQSFFGHYRLGDWLAFDQDLHFTTSMPAPTNAAFRQGLRRRPRLRGIMTDGGLAIAQCIDAFAHGPNGDRAHLANLYADLTGVEFPPERVHTGRVEVYVLRLDLMSTPCM